SCHGFHAGADQRSLSPLSRTPTAAPSTLSLHDALPISPATYKRTEVNQKQSHQPQLGVNALLLLQQWIAHAHIHDRNQLNGSYHRFSHQYVDLKITLDRHKTVEQVCFSRVIIREIHKIAYGLK